ncbi:uncharacterized protein DUF2637 [Kribbella steppae]|uniref:Uncharacterized protein DUF2637 n=1 Tax=Kribbella steppae TaxID=2512223 RepID=A0A4R2HQC0_9ACTN|nr:DUF2637 domain-containing protein [Kribbella steppae]TCO33372.1 uncharacterized protein DUF2637 [Kribbella steppae]
MTTLSINLPEVFDPGTVTWPMIAAGVAGLLILAAVLTGLIWAARRAVRSVTAAVVAGRLTTRRVLITVAVIAALGVAGIGGARSFGAVSQKFDSPLVPLVADGMIVACTALRLAALTRGWRIPAALVTTYVFIGGTVWLNIDTAHGIADAVAHALAPLAYAVLVEMLAHLLRLHLRLAQPAKPRLSALTWITSPVITTRVWLHLSRTGSDDPVAARALVQQVIRMASRLATLCPSRKLWPLDAPRAARTAALQTIRDGLLSAGELASLLPAGGRVTPGELLALVDSAALGLTAPITPDESVGTADVPSSAERIEPPGAPVWLLAYLIGALRTASSTAPVHHPPRTAPTAPVHNDAPSGAPASVHAPHRTDLATHEPAETGEAAPRKTAGPSDAELLDAVVRHAADQGGAPLGQREIRRATEEAFGRPVGFGRAKRLQELAGWAEPTATESADDPAPAPQVRGQLQLVSEPGENDPDNNSDDTTTSPELESSTSR